jgi:hypothetical protein
VPRAGFDLAGGVPEADMITLVFRNSTPESVSRGPVPSVRIDREIVTGGGSQLARHRNHVWQVEGREFLRMDCADAVTVHLERGDQVSPVYGPFIHFSSTDGICYADHEVFAHFDEDSTEWFSHRDRKWWSAMVVKSV